MTLVDTDVLVDFIRGHAPGLAWFRSVSPLPAIPGVVIMELIQGARNRQEVSRIEKFVLPFPRAWPTEAECELALSEFVRLRLSHGVGLLDAVIASIAASRSATLYTFNGKHFMHFAGLQTSEPYTR